MPDLAGGNMMQGTDNVSRSGLSYIIKRDRIVWTEPAPGFMHVLTVKSVAAFSYPGDLHGRASLLAAGVQVVQRESFPALHGFATNLINLSFFAGSDQFIEYARKVFMHSFACSFGISLFECD